MYLSQMINCICLKLSNIFVSNYQVYLCVEPDGAECWCAGAGVSSGSDASRDEQAPRDGRGTVLDSEVLLQFIFPGEWLGWSWWDGHDGGDASREEAGKGISNLKFSLDLLGRVYKWQNPSFPPIIGNRISFIQDHLGILDRFLFRGCWTKMALLGSEML